MGIYILYGLNGFLVKRVVRTIIIDNIFEQIIERIKFKRHYSIIIIIIRFDEECV